MQETRVTRTLLSNEWKKIFGKNATPLLAGCNLRQSFALKSLTIFSSLPSFPAFYFIGNPSLDIEAQRAERYDAFNAAPGNGIRVRVILPEEIIEFPSRIPIKNVIPSMVFDLSPLLWSTSRPTILESTDAIEIKLDNPLGEGDSVLVEANGAVFVDDHAATGY